MALPDLINTGSQNLKIASEHATSCTVGPTGQASYGRDICCGETVMPFMAIQPAYLRNSSMRAAEICTSLIFCSFLTTASEGGLGMGAGWQQSPCGACVAATGAGLWETCNKLTVANGHAYVHLQQAAHCTHGIVQASWNKLK